MKAVPLREVVSIDRDQRQWAGRPYVGMEDIESGTGRLLGNEDTATVKSTTFGFTNRHVLYGRLRPYLNKVLLPDFSGHCSTEIMPLLPTSGIDRSYLWYWLTSASTVAAIDATCTGARMPRANMDAVLELEIPLPSLEEQRRIVAVLDEAFAAIAAATANATKNLANARELFESYLDGIFDQNVESWERGNLTELGGDVSTGPFGSLLHKSDYVENGIPLVNPAHIIGERIEPDFRKSISLETLARLSAYVLVENDIVIGRRGEIGRCAVVTANENGWLCGTGCFFIRPKKSANPHFLAHLLRSRPYRETLEAAATGATMLNLSNTALSELEIAIPSLLCQNEHVERLDEISALVVELEKQATAKIAALDALKQSLLHRAFTGELATTPELALA